MEASFRYIYRLNGDGCVFVFVDVLVFLVYGLWLCETCEFLFFVIVFGGVVCAAVDVGDVAVCLGDEAVYFFDVFLQVDFALFSKLFTASLAYAFILASAVMKNSRERVSGHV